MNFRFGRASKENTKLNYRGYFIPRELKLVYCEDLSKKILVESDSDGLSNLIRTLVNLFFVEISRFEHSN